MGVGGWCGGVVITGGGKVRGCVGVGQGVDEGSWDIGFSDPAAVCVMGKGLGVDGDIDIDKERFEWEFA